MGVFFHFFVTQKIVTQLFHALKKEKMLLFWAGPSSGELSNCPNSLLLILLSLLSLLLHFKLLLKSCIQPVPSTQGHRHVRLETLQSHKMIFLPSENKECVQHRHVTTAVQCFDGVVVLFW